MLHYVIRVVLHYNKGINIMIMESDTLHYIYGILLQKQGYVPILHRSLIHRIALLELCYVNGIVRLP